MIACQFCYLYCWSVGSIHVYKLVISFSSFQMNQFAIFCSRFEVSFHLRLSVFLLFFFFFEVCLHQNSFVYFMNIICINLICSIAKLRPPAKVIMFRMKAIVQLRSSHLVERMTVIINRAIINVILVMIIRNDAIVEGTKFCYESSI